jgi:hypothetical protein
MRTYISSAILLTALGSCLFVGFIETKAANIESASSADIALSQLEDRFFEHRYESESNIDRIDRLEDFVFGTHQTGSTNDRVKRLLATIPQDEPPQSDSTPMAKTVEPAQHNNVASAAPSAGQNPAFNYGSYPRVTNLEQELLGHTYPNDSLPDRIKRLEIKAYGAPSGSTTELADKVDLLDDYAQRHDLYGEHKSVISPIPSVMAFNPTTPLRRSFNHQQSTDDDSGPWGPGAQQSAQHGAEQSSYPSDTSFIGSAEERVSMMEAQVFKHTYPDKSIDQRLKKLAKKIMPDQDIANLAPAEQTVKLWDTLHPNEKDQVAALAKASQSSDEDNKLASNSSGKRGSWLHRLATAGGSIDGTSMSPSSNTPAAYGTNAGYMPGMFPANSHFVGMSVGPGAGAAGLPVGFW